MARHVFFSFHYQQDIFRVNQIRNLPEVIEESAAGFRDKSLWEESKKKGDAAIKTLIDNGLIGTSVTVVCIGSATAGRKYINYEIEQSIARGNGVVGVQIHHLKSVDGTSGPVGATPTLLTDAGYPIYKYTTHADLKRWIDAAAKAAGK
ncbi:MAG: TIR domain-containing protein [Alphaproteobacteria bacterium]|nr:TIR domain-containing protein [Alphaproteobacteria bacterium]MBU0793136.1 TIR domain-containing protein [Alphaproteobacteria bacterium]MBU0875603.1 TIR domain-containing protein [Alphaproteobacteria bacterium]MBU1771308.1 TIR domain-containing protein [Alphaproteobacteria bacterium]